MLTILTNEQTYRNIYQMTLVALSAVLTGIVIVFMLLTTGLIIRWFMREFW